LLLVLYKILSQVSKQIQHAQSYTILDKITHCENVSMNHLNFK